MRLPFRFAFRAEYMRVCPREICDSRNANNFVSIYGDRFDHPFHRIFSVIDRRLAVSAIHVIDRIYVTIIQPIIPVIAGPTTDHAMAPNFRAQEGPKLVATGTILRVLDPQS